MRLFFKLFLVAATLSMPTWAQENSGEAPLGTTVTVDVGKRFQLQSAILGESRDILVRVPEGYEESSARYPVVYVLDGNSHFAHASFGAGLLEENERMPASIIVALPNAQGTRGRDLAREQGNFQRFINEEVFTFVEANYRTNAHKTLFGHSLAGYFTLTMLADHSDMFDAYIAASPVVQVRESEVIDKLSALFSAQPDLKKALYFTLTNVAEEGQAATDALNRLVELLEETAPGGLNWRYEFIDAQVHMTTPYLTVYEGLSHAFSDYQAPRFASVLAFQLADGMAGLEAYFAQRSAKYGREAQIPQATLRRVAYLHMEEGLHDEALALFAKNIATFPENPRVYNSLGDGYEAAGKLAEALDAYKKAVEKGEAQGSRNTGFFQRQVARLEEKLAD